MTNYSRGRAREYKTMQLLRASGYVCSRSAMSHGPVDVFAAKAGRILLIQVKSGSARVKKQELRLLKKWAAAFDAEAQVWSFKKRGRLVRVTVSAKSRMTLKKQGNTQSIQIEEERAILDLPGPLSVAIHDAPVSDKSRAEAIMASDPSEDVPQIHPPSVS